MRRVWCGRNVGELSDEGSEWATVRRWRARGQKQVGSTGARRGVGTALLSETAVSTAAKITQSGPGDRRRQGRCGRRQGGCRSTPAARPSSPVAVPPRRPLSRARCVLALCGDGPPPPHSPPRLRWGRGSARPPNGELAPPRFVPHPRRWGARLWRRRSHRACAGAPARAQQTAARGTTCAPRAAVARRVGGGQLMCDGRREGGDRDRERPRERGARGTGSRPGAVAPMARSMQHGAAAQHGPHVQPGRLARKRRGVPQQALPRWVSRPSVAGGAPGRHPG